MKKTKLSLETLASAITTVFPVDFLMIVDLTDASLHSPVQTCYLKFLLPTEIITINTKPYPLICVPQGAYEGIVSSQFE